MRRSKCTIGEVKARFAEHVRRAEAGETIVLTRHGRPVARLAPLVGAPARAGEVREPAQLYDGAPAAAPERASRREAMARFLEEEVWPRIPSELLERGFDKQEREELLGYGSDGV